MALSYRHITLAVIFFMSSSVVFALAIIGLSNLDIGNLNIIVDAFSIAFIPICIYLGLFTKFNNPFKKT